MACDRLSCFESISPSASTNDSHRSTGITLTSADELLAVYELLAVDELVAVGKLVAVELDGQPLLAAELWNDSNDGQTVLPACSRHDEPLTRLELTRLDST